MALGAAVFEGAAAGAAASAKAEIAIRPAVASSFNEITLFLK
jgi:hypothetical protein